MRLCCDAQNIASTIFVPSGVVLRGQASSGASATVLVLASGAEGPVLAMGPKDLFDQTCYNNSNYTNAVVNLAADAVKEQSKVLIAPNNSTFAAGDFALIDEQNDPAIVTPGDSGGAFARKSDRVLSQRVEIVAVDTASGTLTLASPLHWTFKTSKAAQITKANDAVTKWAGIEHLWVQGGQGLGEYLGRKAGGIDISNAAYCWVKDVQTDGTLSGMHITLTGTNRCVVRDSHFHNSAQYGFGPLGGRRSSDQSRHAFHLTQGAAAARLPYCGARRSPAPYPHTRQRLRADRAHLTRSLRPRQVSKRDQAHLRLRTSQG
jgi:hypothetical protein